MGPAQVKSYAFALRIVKLHRYLVEEQRCFTIGKQILRSGTSVGANVEEAQGSISKKEFRMKMSIAYKEARETHYWLRLLKDSRYLPPKLAHSLINDCEELLKIIGSIVKNAKE